MQISSFYSLHLDSNSLLYYGYQPFVVTHREVMGGSRCSIQMERTMKRGTRFNSTTRFFFLIGGSNFIIQSNLDVWKTFASQASSRPITFLPRENLPTPFFSQLACLLGKLFSLIAPRVAGNKSHT